MKFDYLIVGAGIYAAAFVENAKKFKKTCMVIEKRNHLAGNCFTEIIEEIDVHKYGCHIFNTRNKSIWNYVNQFGEFNNYKHTGKVTYKNKIYSFPINLMTLNQIWGIKTPSEATKKLQDVKVKIDNPQNMEEWCLANIGKELYDIFIKDYSTKQWGKSPKSLPSSIIKRIPIRLTFDDNYYGDDSFQGIPKDGYTNLIKNMFGDVKIELETDFFNIKHNWEKYAKQLVFCGPIDKFYDYEFGKLQYRSLKWDNIRLNGDYQGCSVMNFNDDSESYTRIIEHKHFNYKKQNKTIISKEYPVSFTGNNEPYYPINDALNNEIYHRYNKIKNKNILITGRLGKYKYLDMDDCISLALKESRKICS